MPDLLTYGAAALRKRAKSVFTFDEDIFTLLDAMIEVMREHRGIGLSANQIGSPLAVCVVEIEGTLLELINPQIIDGSEPSKVSEACLSIPGWADELDRWGVVRGIAQDRYGESFKFHATHLNAQAIQHETDHLTGILFTDRALNDDFQKWHGLQEKTNNG